MGLERKTTGAAYKRENDQTFGIAPIAAHFEYCLQYFERLSASLESRPSGGNYIYSTVDGCLSEFRIWGNDTGAPEGLLDHALRKSSRLQKAAKDLLIDLYSTLRASKTFIYSKSAKLVRYGANKLSVYSWDIIVYVSKYTFSFAFLFGMRSFSHVNLKRISHLY